MGLLLEIVRYQPLARTLISTSVLIKPNQFVLRSVRQFVAGTLEARQSRNKSFGTPHPKFGNRRKGTTGISGPRGNGARNLLGQGNSTRNRRPRPQEGRGMAHEIGGMSTEMTCVFLQRWGNGARNSSLVGERRT